VAHRDGADDLEMRRETELGNTAYDRES